jgi:hypothetical protein
MRQTISALLLGAAGFGLSFVLERYVTAFPEWAWRVIGLLCLLAGLVGSALTDTGWAFLRSMRPWTLYLLSGVVGAAFAVVVAIFVVRPLLVPKSATSTAPVPFLVVRSSIFTKPIPDGFPLEGMEWNRSWIPVYLTVANDGDAPAYEVDLLIGTIEHMAGVRQIAGPSSVDLRYGSGELMEGTPVMETDDGTLATIENPQPTVNRWRMYAQRLGAKDHVTLLIAVAQPLGVKDRNEAIRNLSVGFRGTYAPTLPAVSRISLKGDVFPGRP